MKPTILKNIACMAMISAAILGTGCQKEEVTPNQDQNRAPLTVTATIEATPSAEDTKTNLESTPNTLDTKSYLDATTMTAFWKTDDKIGITAIPASEADVVNKPFTLSSGADTKRGTFTEETQNPETEWPKGEAIYLAVYPYQTTTITEDPKAIMSYPHIQYAMQGPGGNFSSGVMAARATSTGVPTNLSFQNLFSIIKISLTGTGTLTKVTFKDLSGKPVSGEYTLGVESGFPEFPDTPANDEAKSIELSLSLTLTADAQDIYLAVPAREYASGFEYVFCCGSQKMTKTMSGSKTLEAGKYYTYSTPLPFTKDAVSNLSSEGTANSYIVTAAGTYSFDADVMGNGSSGIIPDVGFHATSAAISSVSQPKILWQDATNPLQTDGLTYNPTTKKVTFKTAATFVEGNAVIAVKDVSDNILWSWHIWCTDIPTDQAYVNKEGNHYIVMDRNLGAISNSSEDGESSYGLFYQWGRKDPFQRTPVTFVAANKTDAFTNGNIAYAISHPTTFITATDESDYDWYYGGGTGDDNRNNYLWGNPYGYNYPNKSGVNVPYTKTGTSGRVVHPSKTIYDPCPPGYIVAPSDTWTYFNSSYPNGWSNGWTFRIHSENENTTWYPAAGYRNYGYGSLSQSGSNGYYWSSSPYSSGKYANSLYFLSGYVTPLSGNYRADGIPVRCRLYVFIPITAKF